MTARRRSHCASLVGRQPPISYIYRGGVTTLRTREWSLISSPSRHGVHRMHGLDGATGYRIERCRLCACTAQPLLRPKHAVSSMPPCPLWSSLSKLDAWQHAARSAQRALVPRPAAARRQTRAAQWSQPRRPPRSAARPSRVRRRGAARRRAARRRRRRQRPQLATGRRHRRRQKVSRAPRHPSGCRCLLHYIHELAHHRRDLGNLLVIETRWRQRIHHVAERTQQHAMRQRLGAQLGRHV